MLHTQSRATRCPARHAPGPTASLRLAPEGATLGEARQAPGWLAQHDITVPAQDDGLSMTVHSGDLETTRAFDIHEETVGGLDHALQLVLGLLFLDVWVQQIDIHGCKWQIT